jgi:hypothetical protein
MMGPALENSRSASCRTFSSGRLPTVEKRSTQTRQGNADYDISHCAEQDRCCAKDDPLHFPHSFTRILPALRITAMMWINLSLRTGLH